MSVLATTIIVFCVFVVVWAIGVLADGRRLRGKMPKAPKHRHEWVPVDKIFVQKPFVRSRLFRDPIPFAVDCIAWLERCAGCGEERAGIRNAAGKLYVDNRDIPPGTEGVIDPVEFYALQEALK